MANYVIGDVQGCFDSLTALLKHLNFNQEHDVLWFAGDLVNRGPKSLETLQFISGLGDRAHTVLGNHDLHLLALWCQQGRTHSADTIEQVVQSPQGSQLVDWLRPALAHRWIAGACGHIAQLVTRTGAGPFR